jgi:hypothetical protein
VRVTWSVPLPGPFRISGRVGGRRNQQAGPVITLIAYLIVAVVVVVYGVVWSLVAVATGLWQLGTLALTRRRNSAHGKTDK